MKKSISKQARTWALAGVGAVAIAALCLLLIPAWSPLRISMARGSMIEYAQSRYADSSFEYSGASYDADSGLYTLQARSPSGVDAHFTLRCTADGKVSDDYADAIERRGSTRTRLQSELEAYVLQSLTESTVLDVSSVTAKLGDDDSYDANAFTPGMELDATALPQPLALELLIVSDGLGDESVAKALITVDAALDARGVDVHAYTLTLLMYSGEPGSREGLNQAVSRFTLSDFPAEGIADTSEFLQALSEYIETQRLQSYK
ncbi:MAG: hypothetical protein Q4B99_02280 [Clostridia bacterium]|nr:hypothetical protein [Clostridia bacterium]